MLAEDLEIIRIKYWEERRKIFDFSARTRNWGRGRLFWVRNFTIEEIELIDLEQEAVCLGDYLLGSPPIRLWVNYVVVSDYILSLRIVFL